MDGNAITKIVTHYMAAWNEPEDAARRACSSDAGATAASISIRMFRSPGVTPSARQIAKVLASRPGARLEFMSGIDVHHNVVRFLWRLVRADGTCGDTSIDFGEVGPDGRLVKIVGFFGATPSAPLNRPTCMEPSAGGLRSCPLAASHVMTPEAVTGAYT